MCIPLSPIFLLVNDLGANAFVIWNRYGRLVDDDRTSIGYDG